MTDIINTTVYDFCYRWMVSALKTIRLQLVTNPRSLEATSTNALTIIATKCDDVEASEYLSLMNDTQQEDYNNMKKKTDELQAQKASLAERDQIEEAVHTQRARQGWLSFPGSRREILTKR